MKSLNLNNFIKENHLFYFFLKNHIKTRKLIKNYTSDYKDLCVEVEDFLKKISDRKIKEQSVSYLFDVSKNEFSFCSPYREDIYSVYYKDKINIFRGSDTFILLPEERNAKEFTIGKLDCSLSEVFCSTSDYLQGKMLYNEIRNLILSASEITEFKYKLKCSIYKEFCEIKTLYDLLKKCPFLLKYFPENYLKEEREWMCQNLEYFPTPSEEEVELFEINWV